MDGHDPLSNPTVLVVDDERDLARLYADQLDDDYDVRVAHDGASALEELDHTVDVVLLDRRMPEISGDMVLERLRERGFDCRVVMVTAIDPDLDVVELPFEAYLTKPIDGQELNEAVNEQLIYATYDDKIREYTRVRSKIDVLREHEPDWILEDDERFERLRLLADSIKEDIESLLEDHERHVSGEASEDG